jgi:hypothetical protein
MDNICPTEEERKAHRFGYEFGFEEGRRAAFQEMAKAGISVKSMDATDFRIEVANRNSQIYLANLFFQCRPRYASDGSSDHHYYHIRCWIEEAKKILEEVGRSIEGETL